MTPKQQYEARKAERKKRAEDMHNNYTARKTIDEADMLDMFDRFVTAAERIADAMERPQAGCAWAEHDHRDGGAVPCLWLPRKWRGLMSEWNRAFVTIAIAAVGFGALIVVMPDGQTVATHIKPRIAAAYEQQQMVPLLPPPRTQ